jgi:ABC-type amino acid transport substrate-binding protein
MAKKTPKAAATEEDDTPEGRERSKKRAGDKKLLEELRENYKLCVESDRENRDRYKTALKFCYVPGEQWEQTVKTARGPNRVTREFNETRVKVKAVVNHIRSNRPKGTIRPVEEGDVENAQARNGIVLNIWNTSDADNVTDFAAETQVAAGMGAWMIDTEYTPESVDDQDIYIRSIRNPLCLYADYASKEQDKSDARFWIYHTKLSKTAFKDKYGNAEQASFEPEELGDNDPNDDEESVWVAAYWKKVPVTRHLCKLSTGETVDKEKLGALPEGVAVIKEREAKSYKIVQYICSSDAVLEGPNDWAGMEFPFVVVYGEYVVVDGKTYWYGMTQTMMDAQRSHNETLSGVYETIALAPQAKYWATPEQAKDVMKQWKQATDENLPVMLYNSDPKAPGPPARVGGADVPAALMQASQMSRDSINSVSSVPDANVGLTSNESSGKAIRARQDSGLVGTYNYSDNIAKGIGRTYKILIDLIPKVIDTPRSFRILGKDGAEKYIKVNQQNPTTGEIINDLSKGKYDFVITQGPNVQTQRQEAFDFFTQMATADPALMITAGDIVYRNSDAPGAQEIAERRRLALPPEIQQAVNQGKPLPPEVAAAMQQVQMGQQQVAEQGAMVQQAAQEAQTEKSAADKAKADVQVAAANLKVLEANLEVKVAQFEKLVAQTQAQQAQQQATDTSAQTDQQRTQDAEQVQTLVQGVADALTQIQEQTAQFLAASMQQLSQIAVAPKPATAKTAESERVNGKIVTRVVDSNGQEQMAVTERVGGKLVTQIQPGMVQ